jgi:hypothetical protein
MALGFDDTYPLDPLELRSGTYREEPVRSEASRNTSDSTACGRTVQVVGEPRIGRVRSDGGCRTFWLSLGWQLTSLLLAPGSSRLSESVFHTQTSTYIV